MQLLGLWWDQVVPGIPLDSSTCPTWYSGIGRTGGMWWAQVLRTWDSIGQSHLSYMVQWDRMVGCGGPRWYMHVHGDSPTCPTWYGDSGI